MKPLTALIIEFVALRDALLPKLLSGAVRVKAVAENQQTERKVHA